MCLTVFISFYIRFICFHIGPVWDMLRHVLDILRETAHMMIDLFEYETFPVQHLGIEFCVSRPFGIAHFDVLKNRSLHFGPTDVSR